MKTNFLSLVFLLFVMISCQNDQLNDMTIKLDTSSKLTVKLVDSKGAAISNANVKIYDRNFLSSSSSSSPSVSFGYLFSESTDGAGMIDFGQVASGTYFLAIDSVRVNGVKYNPILQFQINSSDDKQIVLSPEEYVTTLNLNLQKAEVAKTNNLVTYTAFSGLNVIFVPSYSFSYNSNYSIDKLISLAEAVAKSNANGVISVKVPAYKSFVAIAFDDAKSVYSALNISNSSSYSSGYFSGDKGQNLTYNFALDSKTLASSAYGIYNLTIKKPVYAPLSTSPSSAPFSDLNVAAIPSSDYDSSLPLSMLLDYVEFSGKTDASGKISLSLASGKNYQVIVYNDNKTVYTTLSLSSYSSFYVYQDEAKQASFTLSPTTLTPVTYGKVSVSISKTASIYYTYSPTDLSAFSGLSVALIPYSSTNSSLSIDGLLALAVCAGTTDASGKILFTIPVYSSYSSYYQLLTYDATKTNKYLSTSFSVYSGSTSTQSYILNQTSLASVN
jgi:hypothetical protein